MMRNYLSTFGLTLLTTLSISLPLGLANAAPIAPKVAGPPVSATPGELYMVTRDSSFNYQLVLRYKPDGSADPGTSGTGTSLGGSLFIPAGPSSVSESGGLAFGNEGYLYVAEQEYGADLDHLLLCDPVTGAVATDYTVSSQYGASPYATGPVAVSPNGSILSADTFDGSMGDVLAVYPAVKHNADGSTSNVLDNFGASGPDSSFITGLTFGGDGDIYAGGFAGGIDQFSSGGLFTQTIFASSQGSRSASLATGPDGNVYFTLNYSYNGSSSASAKDGVMEFNVKTGVLTSFVVSGSSSLGTDGTGVLYGPTALAWGPDGDLYVAGEDGIQSNGYLGPEAIFRYDSHGNPAPNMGKKGAVWIEDGTLPSNPILQMAIAPYPAPTLTSVTNTSGGALTSANSDLLLNGTNFIRGLNKDGSFNAASGTQVTITGPASSGNASPVTGQIKDVSSDGTTIDFLASSGLATGTYTATVTNPGGGTASIGFSVTTSTPTPVITSAVLSNNDQTITVQVQNLAASSSFSVSEVFAGTTMSGAVIGSTVTLSLTEGLPEGPHQILITNEPDGIVSAPFTVIPAPHVLQAQGFKTLNGIQTLISGWGFYGANNLPPDVLIDGSLDLLNPAGQGPDTGKAYVDGNTQFLLNTNENFNTGLGGTGHSVTVTNPDGQKASGYFGISSQYANYHVTISSPGSAYFTMSQSGSDGSQSTSIGSFASSDLISSMAGSSPLILTNSDGSESALVTGAEALTYGGNLLDKNGLVSSSYYEVGPVGVVAVGGANVIAAGGGNVIAAGGGNIIDLSQADSVIAAGGNNVIAAGGGNVIAAGGNNVIAVGGNNVIAAGGGNVIAAGGGNVIAAGGGNVIAAGGGNVIAAGGGNVIAAGGANDRSAALRQAYAIRRSMSIAATAAGLPLGNGVMTVLNNNGSPANLSIAGSFSAPLSFGIAKAQTATGGPSDFIIAATTASGQMTTLLDLRFTPGQPDQIIYQAPGVSLSPVGGTPAPLHPGALLRAVGAVRNSDGSVTVTVKNFGAATASNVALNAFRTRLGGKAMVSDSPSSVATLASGATATFTAHFPAGTSGHVLVATGTYSGLSFTTFLPVH